VGALDGAERVISEVFGGLGHVVAVGAESGNCLHDLVSHLGRVLGQFGALADEVLDGCADGLDQDMCTLGTPLLMNHFISEGYISQPFSVI